MTSKPPTGSFPGLRGLPGVLVLLCFRLPKRLALLGFCRALGWLPGRRAVVNLLGSIVGAAQLLRDARRWGYVARFREVLGAPGRSAPFVIRFFLEQGRLWLWTRVYCEAAHALRNYVRADVSPDDLELLLKGRAMLLGAHYGPELTRFLLHGLGVETAVLARDLPPPDRFARWPRLRTARGAFFDETRDLRIPVGSEKRLVKHIGAGGNALILADFPSRQPQDPSCDFLGSRRRFHAFPFKLALRHQCPVFYCFFERAGRSGYVLRVTRAQEFTDPAEGVRRYAEKLAEVVRRDSSPWLYTSHFASWTGAPDAPALRDSEPPVDGLGGGDPRDRDPA